MHRCLLQASFEKHESIAFPMLGSGNLGYPCENVARAMFLTINSFFDEMPHSTLQTVTIVVHSRNLKAIQVLFTCMQMDSSCSFDLKNADKVFSVGIFFIKIFCSHFGLVESLITTALVMGTRETCKKLTVWAWLH